MSGSPPLIGKVFNPPPFYCHPKRFGAIWSARSACSAVALWFYWHCGWLEEARALHWFPHRYRSVMNKSAVYRSWRRDCRIDETPFLRVIRDPYKRTVSSFHSAVRRSQICRADISRFLDRNLDDHNGFSFVEFLDYLEAIDVSSCNIHIRQQFNQLETMVEPVSYINADAGDLYEGLNEFERFVGLAPTDFHSPPVAEGFQEARHKHVTKRFDPGRDFTAERLERDGVDGHWPSYDSLLTETTRRRIENIYQRDFESYRRYL